jgi:hypothetical protein
LASITLTMAMSFATVLGRHRRIQRADLSRQKKQTSTETSRDDFAMSRIFRREGSAR